MTDSVTGTRGGKRERLAAAAAEVFHRQGVAATTLADIARAADVPPGNVYYYFKTKDQLVEAALATRHGDLRTLTARFERIPEPAERLKALIADWIGRRETTARYGCPLGTLAAELGKRENGLDRAAGDVMRALIDWAAEQFRLLGRAEEAPDLAVELIAAYQGMSLLTYSLRDSEVMSRQGRRLLDWIDSLAAAK